MKFISGIFIVILLFSCNKKVEKSENEISVFDTNKNKVEVKAGNKNLVGYSLITSSDCLSCHKDNEKMIGPSYSEIAEKYSDKDLEMLASKIIDGGNGVWGDVPMQPHPQISKEEAKKMVEYIMSLK